MTFRQTLRNKFSIVLFLAAAFLIAPLICAAQEKIVFCTDRDTTGNREIYSMNPDGSGQTLLISNAGDNWHPAISADGSKIVFASTRDGGFYEIYVMNADGSNVTRLTNNSTNDYFPSFNGDASKIAFTSERDGIREVYVMNADGTGQTRLTNSPGGNSEPSFSPDGNKIAFTSGRDGNYEIYVMNANGTGQTRLTNDPVWDIEPSFSADSSKIAFSHNTGGIDWDVFVMNANGTNQTNLTNYIASVDAQNPTFSPDGSKIAFESYRDEGSYTELYVMNADGSNQVRLTYNPNHDYYASWGGHANTAPAITAAAGVSRARAAGMSNSLIATVSDAEDAENALVVTVNGLSGATSNGVTVSNIAVDSSGFVTANIEATCGAGNASFTLRVTDGGALFNEATLNVGVTNETTAPVLSLPPNIVTSLPMNSTDTSKIVNFTVSATDNCDANPVVAAVPASGSTFPVGTTTVNVTATDVSGNTATGSFTVTVLYNFGGFFQPVDNLPTVNTVTGGQAIPVKFSLSGNKGLNIFAAGFPASQQIACSSGSPVSSVDETVTAGSSALTYDAASDRYIYVWKTEKSWKGTCRQLIVKLNDGSLRVANFQFR